MVNAALKYREISQTLGSSSVLNAVELKFGKTARGEYERLLQGLSLKGNGSLQNGMDDWISTVAGNMTLAKIAVNPLPFLKQLTSITNYSVEVGNGGAGSFTRRVVDNVMHYRETLDFMYGIPAAKEFLEQRFAAGYNDVLSSVLSDAPEKKSLLPAEASYSLNRFFSWLTRTGDLGPIIFGGKAMIDHNLARGMSMDDAVYAWERATLRSQQSSTGATMSLFQQNRDALHRLASAFKNTSFQYARKMNDSWIQYRNGDISRAEFLKTEVNYFVLQSLLVSAAGMFYNALWNLIGGRKPDDDENWLLSVLGDMIAAPFAAIPYVNDIIGAAVGTWSGRHIPMGFSVVGFSDFFVALNKAKKIIAGGEMSADDIAAALQPFIESTTAVPVGTIRRHVKKIIGTKK
jgi:hypothetical protein